MAIMNQTRSPLPWIGGKHYSARFIVNQFPDPGSYDIYCEPFGGGASVFLTKPAAKHLEIYNDVNKDLVNCWLHLRNHADQMQERLSTLPYSRSLYYDYHRSLFDGTEMESLERAVRWYYVLRSSFAGWERESPAGWKGGIKDSLTLDAKTYRNSLEFGLIAKRFQHVNIDCRDFEGVVSQYGNTQGLRTLIYADPPYIETEEYYALSGDFQKFHTRIAAVLNETPAMVALSYYDHPWLNELYPAAKWRRVYYETTKHSQRTKTTPDKATEVLLCNYEKSSPSLWDTGEVA